MQDLTDFASWNYTCIRLVYLKQERADGPVYCLETARGTAAFVSHFKAMCFLLRWEIFSYNTSKTDKIQSKLYRYLIGIHKMKITSPK